MTVKELCESLEKFDPNLNVVTWDYDEQDTRDIRRIKDYMDNNHGLFHYKEFPVVLIS